ncbi:MAG TPA: TIGR04211 family SH3 domain-containing protein [Gammaproteobacteria bacterium]|nr:TIGR04211 family SH3 domain-containing protein [Gammaproteobacteria bacterium]
MMKKLLALLSLCLFTAGAQAQTLYVSDQLEIQLRSGATNQHRIIRMLPSGTPLEVLEVDQAEGWTRVRAPSGVDGWVLSRFLMPERAARDRLAAAEQRVARLEQENRALNVTIRELRGEKESVAKERGELDQTSRQLAQELEEIRRTASSALALDAENKELKARVLGVEREIQTLQQENARLQDRTARDWFMVGAGVIVLGIIIGLIIPRLRFRRKSSWGEL